MNGGYENLKEVWSKTMIFINNNNLKSIENGPMLELYITDPTSIPNPADWKTELFIATQ